MSLVRQAILAKRKELKDLSDELRSQWGALKADQAARKDEMDRVTADLAELDAWLAANPAV